METHKEELIDPPEDDDAAGTELLKHDLLSELWAALIRGVCQPHHCADFELGNSDTHVLIHYSDTHVLIHYSDTHVLIHYSDTHVLIHYSDTHVHQMHCYNTVIQPYI